MFQIHGFNFFTKDDAGCRCARAFWHLNREEAVNCTLNITCTVDTNSHKLSGQGT